MRKQPPFHSLHLTLAPDVHRFDTSSVTTSKEDKLRCFIQNRVTGRPLKGIRGETRVRECSGRSL